MWDWIMMQRLGEDTKMPKPTILEACLLTVGLWCIVLGLGLIGYSLFCVAEHYNLTSWFIGGSLAVVTFFLTVCLFLKGDD